MPEQRPAVWSTTVENPGDRASRSRFPSDASRESATIGAAQHPSVAEGERDAAQDYLDGFRSIRRSSTRRCGSWSAADPGGTGASPRRGPCAVRPVPPPGPGLRHPGAAALRYAPLAHPGRASTTRCAGVVPALRRPCRGRPLGHRQAPGDGRPRLVPRRVGQATVVARGRRGVRPPGHRPSSAWRSTGGWRKSVAAIGVDELARRRGHRYLTLVYQIDRHHRRLLGRARTQGGDAAGLLRLVRRGAQ